MTPKEKANELCGKYYSRIEHTLSEEYSPHERFIVKQCALIAVDEILNEFPQGFKGNFEERRKQYWVEVKREIENL
jgi:ribosomal protein S17E